MGLKNLFQHTLADGSKIYLDHDRGKNVPPRRQFVVVSETAEGEIRWLKEFPTKTEAETEIRKIVPELRR